MNHELRAQLDRKVAEARVDAARRAEADGVQWGSQDEELIARATLRRALAEHASEQIRLGMSPLEAQEQDGLVGEVLDRAFRGGKILRIWEQYPEALNLIAQGHDNVTIEWPDSSRTSAPALADNEEDLIAQLRLLARHSGSKEREWHPGRPELDLRLPDGSRLTAVAWVTPFTFVALRRHTFKRVTLDDLLANGTISQEVASFLGSAVRAGCNIVIGGPMNSGKTVLLRALVAAMDPTEHVVTVESELELGLDEHPDLYPMITPMEARSANVEGKGAVTQEELVTFTQRMNPTRVVVGEVRGPEVLSLLKAISQGTRTLSTIHSNDSASILEKMAAYAEEFGSATFDSALRRAANGIDLLVQTGQDSTGARRVESVREVLHYGDSQAVTNELYRAPISSGVAEAADPMSQRLRNRLGGLSRLDIVR